MKYRNLCDIKLNRNFNWTKKCTELDHSLKLMISATIQVNSIKLNDHYMMENKSNKKII